MILKNVEKTENNSASFQVATDAAEFDKAVNAAYLKNKASINVPGFRKGKAPRTVIEGMYGKEVFYQDAMDELAPVAFEFGLKEAELRMVGTPAIKDVNITDERTAEYTFVVTLYPVVTLGQYKGLEVSKDSAEVTDEDVENELKNVAKRNARVVTVEGRAAQMGDTANIDFDGYLNGERFDGGKAEGYDLELGSGSFVPGFEEQVVGMNVGEEKDLDITFPENYTPELAGKAVVFKVKLNTLSQPELPEMDDEFAKDVSEFDTLDEYKANLRETLAKTKADQAENKFRADCIAAAVANVEADIPACMVDEKVEEIVRNYAANFGMTDRNVPLQQLCAMMGMDETILNTSIRPGAEFQVKNDMLLEEVVKAENIELTDEQVEEYVAKMAEQLNATPDQLKAYFGVEFMANEHKKELATNLIVDSAVVKAAE